MRFPLSALVVGLGLFVATGVLHAEDDPAPAPKAEETPTPKKDDAAPTPVEPTPEKPAPDKKEDAPTPSTSEAPKSDAKKKAEGEKRPAGRRGPPPSPLMTALDANADGVIDAAEIANAAKALKTLDKNGDGKLAADETRPQRPERRGGREGRGGGGFKARMLSYDADGDGKVSRDEAPERMEGMFDRLDSDGDGFIDEAEMDALAERWGGGRGGRGGGREGGGGGR